jgi:AcrR family transcriptional regulator
MVIANSSRSAGRNARQAAQHAATRTRLIRSGITVIARKGFADAVVADILSEARISRATFYAHFDSLIALVEAAADDFAPVWQPVFTKLATMLDADRASLRIWCADMVATYRQNETICVVLAQAAMLDNDFYWKVAGYQAMLIDMLAEGHSRLAHLKHDEAARVRAALALTQLDQACYFLAVRRWADDPRSGIDAMAAHLHFFLTSETGRT